MLAVSAKGVSHMTKKRKAKRTKVKRKRRAKKKRQHSRDVDVLSPAVSDEALEREGLTSVVKTVMNPATVCCY
jgi:hypothetical protein